MKKIIILSLVILQLGLLSIIFLDQFKIGSILLAKKKVEKSDSTESSEENPKAQKSKKALPFDKGPSTIDVSKYPKEMQEIYKKDFSSKCAKCHTIARAINAPYALPDEWRNYILKMMRKQKSGINPSSGRKIVKFLIYDSKIRKKEIIEKKLKEKEKEKNKGKKKNKKH